jgi:hypothetical protein
MRVPFKLLVLSSLLFVTGIGGVNAQTQTATNTTATVTASPTPILQPSALPPCALTCESLKKAELVCEPSTAAGVFATNQTAYHNCFCQSNLTTTLATSPNGVCDVECPVQADRVKIQDWYAGYCNLKPITSPSSTTAAASASKTSSSASGKRRNGLSKNATIGVAVGVSIAMILVAVAIYFPLFKSALFAVRYKIPPPVVEDDREKRAGESNKADSNSGGNEGQEDNGRKGSGSDSEATNVHIITAFKQ